MTELVRYEVTGNDGVIEFRKYPELVLAMVDDPGDDSGFNLLFAYITGSNRKRDRIPMTAPVITAEVIPMTAPVFSDRGMMAFVMPEGKKEQDLPEPVNDRVHLVTIPPREIAVIRFRGYAGKDDVASFTQRLKDGLIRTGTGTSGTPFLMRYNAPWTPGFLRRNEVAVEVRRQKGT